MLTSFWDCLKYSMLHCYLYFFLKFPCILFLFQAESVKAIRGDGKWRDLRKKKTREVWVGEWKNKWGLSQVVYASFLSLLCYYPAVCLFPSILLTKYLEQGKREPLHPIRGVSMETRQTAHGWRNRSYIPPPLHTSILEGIQSQVSNKLLSLLQISPIRYFAKWKSIMPTRNSFF